jgi:hypothetical protein
MMVFVWTETYVGEICKQIVESESAFSWLIDSELKMHGESHMKLVWCDLVCSLEIANVLCLCTTVSVCGFSVRSLAVSCSSY